MSSLHELLSEEGFQRQAASKPKPRKPRDRVAPDDSITLPIFICRERKSIDLSKQRPGKELGRNEPSVSSSKRSESKSGRSNSESRVSNDLCGDGPLIDQVAVRAVISILGGYVGRFSKDEAFRTRLQDAYSVCLSRRIENSNDTILKNMELGINNIEQLAKSSQARSKESKMRSLRNSITFLSIVASLNSPESKDRSTCGIPNSHLSALAQLYLAIVYKLEKNDRISARHLLQVFCDSPSLARKHLLPDLWEHFFLPHLLHLKVWYGKEVEIISCSTLELRKREKWMKLLDKVYNEHMDEGTALFALYYKEWLKVGGKAPVIPSVTLPSRSAYEFSKKVSVPKSSHPSINKGLFEAVFGPSMEQASLECEGINGVCVVEDGRENHQSDKNHFVTKEGMDAEQGNQRLVTSVHSEIGSRRKSSSQLQKHLKPELVVDTLKSDSSWMFPCHSEPAACAAHKTSILKGEAVDRQRKTNASKTSLSRAINTICTSDSLNDCEDSIRMISRAWLDTDGDPQLGVALSKEPVVEGLLEVMFSSKDNEILELAISILAELVVNYEVNRQMILSSDPHLEIFIRLLRSKNVFLKAAVLLYLLKPKAKQMLSPDWVPLALRILESGNQMQTLFTIQCSPQSAAFYLLDQLMNGFDVDRNIENAKQVVSLGGLRLLIRQLELGDSLEKRTSASLIFSCIQADGCCRYYLANHIKKASIIELLLSNQRKSSELALSLLTELVCLHRRSQINKFLNELKTEGCLNTMHILFAYLQRAPDDQRPLLAVILLQLDLLGDPSQRSVYREEVVEALTEAVDCESNDEKVQEQSSKALLLLGSRFSFAGEASAESWLLKQAGLDCVPSDSFSRKEITANEIKKLDAEELATEDWLGKVATILLTNGSERFLAAIKKSIISGIPSLARACLVTVGWLSNSLVYIENSKLQSLASSILVPCLLESLNYERSLEERVLASLTLLNFIRYSAMDCLLMLFPLDKKLKGLLQNLAQVTWTAKELLSILSCHSVIATERDDLHSIRSIYKEGLVMLK